MKKGINTYLLFSLCFASILGILKYVSVIPFNRMAADDFSFADGFLTSSFFEGQAHWYLSLTGRYTSNFLISFFGSLGFPDGKMIIFPTLTVIFGIFSFSFLFSSVLDKKAGVLKKILISAYLFMLYYFITPNKSQDWYWLNGAATYLWPTLIDIVIISLVIKDMRGVWVYLLIFVLSLIAGGGDELLLTLNLILSATVVFAALAPMIRVNAFSRFLAKLKYVFNKSLVLKKITLVFLASAVSLIVVYFSPGNSGRMSGYGANPMGVFGSIAYAFRDGPVVYWQIASKNIIFLVPTFFILVRVFLSFPIKTSIFDKVKIRENLAAFIVSSSVLLTIPIFTIGYLAFGKILVDRTFITVSFLIIIAIVFSALVCSGLKSLQKKSVIVWFDKFVFVSSFFVFILGIRFASSLAEDVYVAKNYSDAFDSTVKYLRSYKPDGSGEALTVDQLPNSGLVPFWQLTRYPENWENNAIANFFRIKVDLFARE